MSGGLFGVGAGELLLILVIVLLVLGPDRLPQLARLWGRITRFVNKVTRIWAEMNTQITRQLDEEARPLQDTVRLMDPAAPPAPTAPSVAPDARANTILPPGLGAPPPASADTRTYGEIEERPSRGEATDG